MDKPEHMNDLGARSFIDMARLRIQNGIADGARI
jgi:hypothetical protein